MGGGPGSATIRRFLILSHIWVSQIRTHQACIVFLPILGYADSEENNPEGSMDLDTESRTDKRMAETNTLNEF